MAIEIVDFPIISMVIFHSYVAVYQRVWILAYSPVIKAGFLENSPCSPMIGRKTSRRASMDRSGIS
jgi:hypothetical protein